MDIREARKALGWSRDDLAARATVDKRVLQLIELGMSHDTEAITRCEEVLGRVLAERSRLEHGLRES